MRFICRQVREELHLDSFAPYPGAQFDLAGNQILYEGSRQKIHKDRTSKPKGSPVYLRLLSAGRRLMELIQRSQGRANKDMASLPIKSTLCVINGSKQSPSIRTAVSPAACVKLPALGSLLLSLIQIR